jgi:hypothetical protein
VTKRRRCLLGLAGALLAAVPAWAINIPVAARKVMVVDRPSDPARSKVVFVAKDAAISKGPGTSPEDISAQLTVTYNGGFTAGVVSIPAGSANGWRSNSASLARYTNPDAPGGPSDAKLALVRPGTLLKLVTKGPGEFPLSVLASGPPPDPVRTAFCVTNDGQETCHCTQFATCRHKLIAGGSAAKLVCTLGTGDPSCDALNPPGSTTSITTTTSTSTTLPLGDTFDGTSLDPSWSVLNPGLVTITVSGGSLHLEATMSGAGTTWYNDSEGPLVYKAVTGDFDVRTVVSTEDPGNPGNPPPTQYRLAGLLARDPASAPGALDWVHVALGSGATAQGVSYEYKSTAASVSTWATTPTASPDGELRIVRSGAVFDLYWRPDALASWLLIQSFVRADMPATLHVGLMIYATEAPPSIRASFDQIAFF